MQKELRTCDIYFYGKNTHSLLPYTIFTESSNQRSLLTFLTNSDFFFCELHSSMAKRKKNLAFHNQHQQDMLTSSLLFVFSWLII